MNLLIIGGLFGIAVLALIGLVLVIASERRATPRTKATPAEEAISKPQQLAEPTPAVSQPASLDVDQEQTRVLAPSISLPAKETYPVSERPFPLMNGQLHEFSSQLRALHQQTQELEHRLSLMLALVEQAERANSKQMLVDEDLTMPTGSMR